MIDLRVGRALVGLVFIPAIAFAVSDNVPMQGFAQRNYTARPVNSSSLAWLPASSVTFALDRAITDSLGVVLASYDNAGAPGITTNQANTVNQSTGSILFCGKIDLMGTAAAYIIQLDSSGGVPIAAAAFSYQGGHAPVCSGIAVDETTRGRP